MSKRKIEEADLKFDNESSNKKERHGDHITAIDVFMKELLPNVLVHVVMGYVGRPATCINCSEFGYRCVIYRSIWPLFGKREICLLCLPPAMRDMWSYEFGNEVLLVDQHPLVQMCLSEFGVEAREQLETPNMPWQQYVPDDTENRILHFIWALTLPKRSQQAESESLLAVLHAIARLQSPALVRRVRSHQRPVRWVMNLKMFRGYVWGRYRADINSIIPQKTPEKLSGVQPLKIYVDFHPIPGDLVP